MSWPPFQTNHAYHRRQQPEGLFVLKHLHVQVGFHKIQSTRSCTCRTERRTAMRNRRKEIALLGLALDAEILGNLDHMVLRRALVDVDPLGRYQRFASLERPSLFTVFCAGAYTILNLLRHVLPNELSRFAKPLPQAILTSCSALSPAQPPALRTIHREPTPSLGSCPRVGEHQWTDTQSKTSQKRQAQYLKHVQDYGGFLGQTIWLQNETLVSEW